MDDNIQINFISRSILHNHEFSWVFLVDWSMVLASSVFALFYFNQSLGFLFTNTVGWYLWHRYGVYLKIQSIQISLLGGRVIFRNVVYIGTSQALRVVHGTLSWRYWIRGRRRAAFLTALKNHENVHHNDYTSDNSRNTDSTFNSNCTAENDLPDEPPTVTTASYTGSTNLALNLKVYGVEWFVYNREYAYDSLAKQEPATAELAEEFERWQSSLSFSERKVMELSPLHLDVRNLGSVIGNDDTESLVIVSSQRVNCIVDMAAASTEADRYMSVIDARFTKLKVESKDNSDYQVSSITPEKQYRNFSGKTRRHIWMRKLLHRSKREPNKPWFGLKRYLEVDEDDNEKSPNNESYETLNTNETNREESPTNGGTDNNGETTSTLPNTAEISSQLAALPAEYGKVSQLSSCDSLDFQFRVDVVGPVRSHSDDESDHLGEEEKAGMPPPLFDTKMVFYGAKSNYGPYAERQRQTFFQIFFPRNCNQDAMSSSSASSHGLRIHTHATVTISLQDETTMMVPVREKSKDESFAANFVKSLQSFGGEIQRSYGWLEVRAAEGSKIEILVPFVPQPRAGENGDNIGEFATHCDISSQKPVVRSSVNHDTFLCADAHELRSIQYQPNTLNAEVTYKINQNSVNMDCFSLREHVTLISDTIQDFATGPPVPYYLFTPSVYSIDWGSTNLSIYMNVNKGNIINKPCSLSENTFLILRAPSFHGDWNIPRTEIASPISTVKSVSTAPKVDVDLSAPSWHTLQGFLDSQRMASVDNFTVNMHHFMTTSAVSEQETDSQFETNISRFVDTQVIDIDGQNFAMTAHGFFIEYIMRIRENYFGHAYHFQTKEEFLDRMEQERHQAESQRYEFRRGDVDTDTQMHIRVSRGCFLLPKRLFTCKDCIALHFVEMNADSRFTNYYMDLQLEIAPIMGRYSTGINAGTAFDEALNASWSNADLSISNLEAHAHRMFGLPPVEPTYVVKWDFAVGDITADLHPPLLKALFEVKMVFGHSFDDDENKPIIEPEELNDVTFVSLDVRSIDVIVRPTSTLEDTRKTRVQFSTSAIKVRANDLANDYYSGRTSVEVPYVRVRAFASNVKTSEDVLVLEADTAVMVTNYMQKPFRNEQHRKQQDHIALHDLLFKRADFLLNDETKSRYPYTRNPQPDDLKPCIPLTQLPVPMTRENAEYYNSKLFFSAAASNRRNSWDRNSSRHTSLESLVDVEDDAHDSFLSSFDDYDMEDENNSYDDDSDIPSMAKQARAKYSGPTPDVYPFSGQTVSEERERLRETKADFTFQQGPWHPRVPEMQDLDDDMEHSNLSIQIKPMTAHIAPDSMAVVESFQFEEESVDFESQLDMLQIMIIRGLTREKVPTTSSRFYLTVPALDFNFSEEINSKYGGIRFMVESMDLKAHILGTSLNGIEVDFDNLSLSLRQGISFTGVSRLNAAAVILSKFEFWWQQTSEQDSVGSVTLNGIDASLASDQVEWTIEYLSRLIDALPAQVSKNSVSSRKVNNSLSKHDELKATFYALTMAGESMGVEQDSYVLSKPSGTIQSQEHVRTMMSWRIVMRLRYLLQRIPPTQRKKMEDEIASGTYDLPTDAKEQMLDVYRNWRSWEQSKNLEDTEIFKQVFKDRSFQEYVLSLSIKSSLQIASMVARVVYPDMHDHFAGLDSFHLILASTQKNKVQNLGLTVRCSKVRARGSMELVTLSATIIDSLSKIEEQNRKTKEAMSSDQVEEGERATTRPTLPTFKSSSSKELDTMQINQNASRALQANISVFLLDLILEFDLERIHVETQNHQIQFTSAVELMETKDLASLFHIGTSVSTDGAFRVYRSHPEWSINGRRSSRATPQESNNDDIFDSLVTGVQLGYASRGLGVHSNTWATLHIDSVSFMSHLRANDLAHSSVEFLEVEMPAVRRAATKLEAVSFHRKNFGTSESIGADATDKSLQRTNTSATYKTKTSTTKSTASSIGEDEDDNESTAGQFMNVSIGSAKSKTRSVDELRFVWLAKELDFKIRNIGEIVSSLSVERSTVGIHFSETYEAVANIQFELVRAIMKYDPHALESTLFTNADALRLGTMSLVWILEYSKHRRIDVQVSEVMETLNKAMSLLQPTASDQTSNSVSTSLVDVDSSDEENSTLRTVETSRPNTKHPFTLRVANQIGEISIRLPLDSSSFQLTIDGAYSQWENLKNANSGPRTFSGGIKDSKLELLSTEEKSREMIRLQFDLSAHKSKERVLLNLASEYLKFGFDPESVGALFIAIEKLKSHSREFFNAKSTKAIVEKESRPSDGGFHCNIADLENVRAKLLSKNMTIAWFTEADSNEGIVVGYEKLQLKFAKLISSLELSGAYITPLAKTELPMDKRYNTIHVPLVKASALVNKPAENEKPWIRVAVTGESVAMTVIPSVATWLSRSSESFDRTTQTLELLADNINSSSSSSSSSASSSASLIIHGTPSLDERRNSSAAEESLFAKKTLQFPFNVSVNTDFASSVVRLFDEGGRQKEPALELYSPSLQVMFGFENQKSLLRMNASKTTNKVYPKAISEIKAISTLFNAGLKERARKRRHGRERHREYPTPKHQPSQNTSSTAEENSPLANNFPLEGIEIDFRSHFASQEMYISCLPFGKVGASLSTEGVDILIMTPKARKAQPMSHLNAGGMDQSLVTMYCSVKHTQIALQHIYSSEISAKTELDHFAVLGMSYRDEPMKIVSNSHNPKLEIKLTKSHDMRMFFDIWALYENPAKPTQDTLDTLPESTQLRRKYSTNSSISRPNLDSPPSPSFRQQGAINDFEDDQTCRSSDGVDEEANLSDKYKNAMAAVGTALIVNLNIVGLTGIIGMGPAIGDLHIHIDRMWLALLQTPSMEQMANMGSNSLVAKFEGRLGGTLRIDGLMAKTAFKWKHHQARPLVHAKLKFSKSGFYFSLDFHPFIAGNVIDLSSVVTTQDRADVQDDRVHLAITCSSISIITTALVIVHSYDVVALFKRLQSQISSAPIFMMPEVTEETAHRSAKRQAERSKRILEHQKCFEGIRILMGVQLGRMSIHAFPTEFADNISLKIFAQNVDVHYDRTHYSDRHQANMELTVDESMVCLANVKGGGYKDTLTDLDYEKLIAYISQSTSGGTIFNTPEVSVVMDTWQYNKEPNVVYYKFYNDVHGSIDVGWNIGSVSFIKEMLNAHKDAWATRQDLYETSLQHIEEDHRSAQAYREAAANLESKSSIKSSNTGTASSDESSSPSTKFVVPGSSHPARLIQQKEEAEGTPNMELLGTKYVAKETPIVQIPQSHDLGDATPPIEWLGVNRKRIPLFIHAFLMKRFEMSADEVEKLYLEVIGRMD